MRFAPALLVLFALPLTAAAQVGDVAPVHDPCVVRTDAGYVVYNTGRGGPSRTSPDLFTWRRTGAVLPTTPDWTRAYTGGYANSMWAPDVTRVGTEYRLYYAVSTFGSRHSAIGLSTSPTLDPARPDYHWTDRGPVVTTEDRDNWNAIDPSATVDADGRPWLVCGSCWSGIKIFPLAPDGRCPPGTRPIAIASHRPDNFIEEGYVRRHGDDYYLWVSVGRCCQGVNSTYEVRVGRSRQIAGPYKDRDGRPMLDAGGTLVLATDGRVRGPGSSAITDANGHDYLVHHMYDADRRGRPTMQVRPLAWDADGWPLAGEPITRSTTAPAVARSPGGAWTVTVDFAHPSPLTLTEQAAHDGTVTVRLAGADVRCVYGEDGSWFAGHDRDGRLVRGKRTP